MSWTLAVVTSPDYESVVEHCGERDGQETLENEGQRNAALITLLAGFEWTTLVLAIHAIALNPPELIN